MSRYLKITMESGNDDEVYQRTVFVQNYSEHAMQITDMQKLFPAVAGLIGNTMVQAGNEKLASLGGMVVKATDQPGFTR